jgi:PHD/YefM family antitoxin component YafN of YafNO toxin-antitoxin module
MEEDYTTITVTRNGEPVGIILPPDRYEALLETIDILGNQKILQTLNSSNDNHASGKVYTHDEVWED